MNEHHKPVMLKETMDYLINNKAGIYFDGTLGFGGHTKEILSHLNENGKVIATDVDSEALNFCREKFSDERIKLYNFNFSKVDIISKLESIKSYDGIMADLGVSSFQLDNVDSGFTFRQDASLDLRMDKNLTLTAADIINSYPENELANIFYQFGEEKKSRIIASRISEQRIVKKFVTTFDLVKIIESLVPENFRVKTLSRIFQALRICVNNELENLKLFLTNSISLLKSGARLVIISYHSLEDRIVKDIFKYESIDCICPKDYPICKCDKVKRLKIITKKPLLPSKEEIAANRRSRSAKLRVAERI
ncbi:MAG TPA: 16S rRNA (cytosine(1402)-N(4))-methyltransferase RsmH [Ignavibacteriaceae bacterium]|nr:16S rRNA (cytosine(1402)-N(4))-methyltransferase RsmH [Ignavibacteriaceae bacterium]